MDVNIAAPYRWRLCSPATTSNCSTERPSRQWAAVTTHSEPRMLPPQKWEIPPRKFRSDTWHVTLEEGS